MKVLYSQDGTIAAASLDIEEDEVEFIVDGEKHIQKTLGVALLEINPLVVPSDFSPKKYRVGPELTLVRIPMPEAELNALKSDRASKLENAVIVIYQKPITLSREYENREAEALVYKEAGYTGEAGRYLSDFARYRKLDLQAAADLVLLQAQAFRTAEPDLADLRMRKYQILEAADEFEVERVYGQAMVELKAIIAKIG